MGGSANTRWGSVGRAIAVPAAVLLFAGCAHRGAGPTLRHAEAPALDDDLPREPLLRAVEAEARFLAGERRQRQFRFGDRTLSRDEYLDGMRRFVALGRAAPSSASFVAAVEREFDFYRAFPDGVLVTAYYEPVIAGSRRRSARFSQPLYRPPPDLRSPYFTRAEIDSGHALAGRGLELCWVDPLDAFVLQTEGSGTVELDDGTPLALRYGGNNGRPHQRLSQFLRGAIPPDKMTMHTIEAHLRRLTEREMRDVLEKNPRYVFFKPGSDDGATTSLGLPTTDGRTIATDERMPKGALAFLVTTRPRLAPGGKVPLGWEPLRRFVLDQDTGGAIKGARVDLFWGRGAEAGRYAGVIKQPGVLYYLVPKRR